MSTLLVDKIYSIIEKSILVFYNKHELYGQKRNTISYIMRNTLRKIFLLFIIIMSTVCAMNAQSLRAYIKAADNAFAKKDYFTALVYYKKVLEVEPARSEIHFKYAESARLFQAYRIAEDAYQKITTSKDSLRYPLATYWLGSVKKNLGKYEEATVVLQNYLKQFKRVNVRFSKRAERDIVDCKWAARAARSNLDNVVINTLDGGINSPYSEFGAVEIDGTLYFSSMRFEDKKKQLFSKLMRRTPQGEIESFEFNKGEKFAANPALSFDGTRLYYTNCSYDKAGNIKCGIVYREKSYYGDWGNEQDLPTFINFPGYTTTHPTIGYDKINEREILFFVSNRPGGKGKLDIWYSTVAPNGLLTRPVNHSVLNTRENDVTPFFHSPTQTLYFSSDGYPGMGGYDIYKVKRAGRSWQTPVHMTYPLNTGYNDFYFTLNEKGDQSYFASNREEAQDIDEEREACCNDIFTANVKPDQIELTKEEYLSMRTPMKGDGLANDEPKVVIRQPNDNSNDIPETVLGGNDTKTPTQDSNPIAINSNPNNNTSGPATSPNVNSELIGKGEDPLLVENKTPPSGDSSNSETPSTITTTNSENTSNAKSSNIEFEEDFESLPRDIFSLVFEVEVSDMDLEPLKGVTVQFIEKGNSANAKNFRKSNISGNRIRFRIKDDVNYDIILSKPGFQTDTFAVEQESLIGATELSLPFFLSPIRDIDPFPDSPLTQELKEPEVTEEMLNSYAPIRLYFNNNEPDPASWSNSTNRNYEQTFLLYHSQKEKFKNQYVRKFAASQRDEALLQIDNFFENELKKGYIELFEFSDKLFKYLEKGNKVTIVLQAATTQSSVSPKITSLIQRRISCIKNHFRSHHAGKFLPYLDAGFLEFEILAPINLSTKTNGTYSPEASKLRRVELKILKFNDF